MENKKRAITIYCGGSEACKYTLHSGSEDCNWVALKTANIQYIGKTVRMSGSMSIYHDEETGNTYYACIIKDALACCAQGIEFSAAEGYIEDDFPADGEDLTVVGTYALYEEGGHQYCILKEAALE